METEENVLDDHHCSVIERKRLKSELADCDSQSDSMVDREACHDQVKEHSQQRERACKYS